MLKYDDCVNYQWKCVTGNPICLIMYVKLVGNLF